MSILSFSKKVLSKAAIAILGCICTLSVIPKAETVKAMELNNDEYDKIFIDTVNEYIKENCTGSIELVADKEIIYDLNLNDLGYIYDFTLNTEKGYATVINTNGYPEVAEIYFDIGTPLNFPEYNRIYIANTIYAYNNGTSYYLLSGDEIAEESIGQLSDIAYYSASSNLTTSSETIYYTAKVETAVLQLAKRHPSVDSLSYPNGCVAIAGANLIQYWDRFMPDLIENYTPGVAIGNYYLYNTPDKTVEDMAVKLYNLMGAGTTNDGITISQFKAGMSAYCSGKGYGISYESCMNSGRFNYSQAKAKLNSGYPLMLFTDPATVATITSNGNYDQIQYKKINIAHAMAGFGYKDIRYTLTNGQTRMDNYIEVASGMAECGNGYYNINYDTVIDDAYGVYIY